MSSCILCFLYLVVCDQPRVHMTRAGIFQEFQCACIRCYNPFTMNDRGGCLNGSNIGAVFRIATDIID